jgi:hypothetical protein
MWEISENEIQKLRVTVALVYAEVSKFRFVGPCTQSTVLHMSMLICLYVLCMGMCVHLLPLLLLSPLLLFLLLLLRSPQRVICT